MLNEYRALDQAVIIRRSAHSPGTRAGRQGLSDGCCSRCTLLNICHTKTSNPCQGLRDIHLHIFMHLVAEMQGVVELLESKDEERKIRGRGVRNLAGKG